MKPLIITATFFSLMLSPAWQIAYADDLASIQNLMGKKQVSQAWEQLQALKKSKEGDVKFDYLYGVVAFEAGYYDQAIFALDRVTVNSPNDAKARIYLAQTYLKLHNSQAALKQFRQLQKLQKGALVKSELSQQIKELAKQDAGFLKARFTGSVNLAQGYSNNSNFGAAESFIDVPDYGVIELRPSAQRKTSPFTEIRARANFQFPLSSEHTWFSSLGVSKKNYQNNSDNNYSVITLKTGSTKHVGKQEYSAQVKSQAVYLGEKYFAKTFGVSTAVSRHLTEKQAVKVSLSQERYTDKQSQGQSKNITSLSGSYLFSQEKTQHKLDLSFVKQRPQSGSLARYSHSSAKLSYRASHQWNPKNLSFISLSHKFERHEGLDPIYGKNQKDSRNSISIGHEYRLRKKVTAYATAGYTNNSSNLSLYDASRAQITTGIAFQF